MFECTYFRKDFCEIVHNASFRTINQWYKLACSLLLLLLFLQRKFIHSWCILSPISHYVIQHLDLYSWYMLLFACASWLHMEVRGPMTVKLIQLSSKSITSIFLYQNPSKRNNSFQLLIHFCIYQWLLLWIFVFLPKVNLMLCLRVLDNVVEDSSFILKKFLRWCKLCSLTIFHDQNLVWI